MIAINRDPAFWTAIASHPALSGAMLGLDPEAVGALAVRAKDVGQVDCRECLL